MANRVCLNSPDLFCYVCGYLTDKSHRKTFTPFLKKIYQLYFDSKVDSINHGHHSSTVLHVYAFEWLVQEGKKKQSHDIRSSYDMARAKQSCHRLLFLYGEHNWILLQDTFCY